MFWKDLLSIMSETCRVLYQIKLRNSASRWLLLEEYITMHGPVNVNLIQVGLDRDPISAHSR